MWKWTKSDFENDLLINSIKSASSQFINTILGKLHDKIEKTLLNRFLIISVKMGEKGQI